MERKRETEHNDLLPKKGNPLHETVCYKIGGTIFEIETSCGGSEPLYDKMKRLIKSEIVKTPTDKEKEVRYNEDNNLYIHKTRDIITGQLSQPPEYPALRKRTSFSPDPLTRLRYGTRPFHQRSGNGRDCPGTS